MKSSPHELVMPSSNGLLIVSSARPCRALVVDDNAINRKIMHIILTEAGAQVSEAEDGLQACEAHAHEPFDIILMDIQMPVMDGHAAVRAIRAREAERGQDRTPIIMVSAFVAMKDIDESMRCGADLHLGKPVQVASLLAAVRDALDGWPSREDGKRAVYYP
jgi:CheY-like chemotaxis protein